MYTETKLRSAQDPNKFEKIYSDLENIFEINFSDILKRVEKRLKVVVSILMVATMLLMVIFAQSVMNNGTFNYKLAIVVGGLVFLVPVIFICRSKDEKNLTKNFKSTILDKLVKIFSKNLTFYPIAPDKNNVLNNYKELEFAISKLNIYSNVGDVIQGKLPNDKEARMSELHLSKKHGKTYITLFSGLFVETTLNKSINSSLYVVEQNTDLSNLTRYTKLELESSEFENLFNVYTDNKIIATQFLTSDTLNLLSKLRIDYGMDFDFVIKGNKLNIRFHSANLVDIFSKNNKLNKEYIFLYYCILNYVMLVIDEINKIVDETEL